MNPTDSEIAAAQALLQREVHWPPYSNIYDAVANGKLMTMEQEELHKMARIFCLALHIARKQGRFDILAGHLAKGQIGMEAKVVADFHRNEVHPLFFFCFFQTSLTKVLENTRCMQWNTRRQLVLFFFLFFPFRILS